MFSDCFDLVKNHKFRPASSFKDLARYLESPEDWCLSRQLWWGHRIPAFRVQTTFPLSSLPIRGEFHCQENGELWVVATTDREACNLVEKLGIPAGEYDIHQDEDVLDTWFSSGVIPLTRRQPLSLLETGKDILFFWICRMGWLSEALRHSFPFEAIALHSMVVDSSGKKMSKSRGNIIDPLDVINGQSLQNLINGITSRKELSANEISISVAGMKRLFPKGIRNYGSDVLRLSLVTYLSYLSIMS